MGSNQTDAYLQLVNQLKSYSNIPENLTSSLENYNWSINLLSQQDRFNKPMPWIGLFVASASVLCILAMVADLVHGVRNRKLWFPNKYFTLNAASLTLIAVAMKLPMDISNVMPGVVDQNIKYGSMAFMCTMMANLLPSLATMDNKSLVSNIIGLGVLVITLVVNVCIQMGTGLLPKRHQKLPPASFFVIYLLKLFMIHTCSALAILESKQILESKYKHVYNSSLMDQRRETLNVEKLKQHVRNCWTMPETGSPHFMAACSPTSSASGVTCLIIIFSTFNYMRDLIYHLRDNKSDYKWSMVVILIVQLFGVLLGSIAPLCRCLTPLSFKLSAFSNHILYFGVENYWIKTLYDLKQSSTLYPFHTRKYKIVVQNLKILILKICILIQKSVVIWCKFCALFPVILVVCISFCLPCLERIMPKHSVSDIYTIDEPNQVEEIEDRTKYVLRLQPDMEFAETTLKRISQSLNRFIQKVQKKQPNNLKMLINESSGFGGVGNYDNHHIPSLLTTEYRSSWSLSLVTLTTIAISIPYIQKNKVDRLLRGVSEGLAYVALVEENLNATDDYVSIKKAARTLWWQVVQDHNRLGYNLASPCSTTQVLHLWKNTAIREVKSTDTYTSISANSMYRITETIIHSYNTNIDHTSHEDLFARISSMISDILAACLTNLPQVIVMKCHTNAIEKREVSVRAAAQLLGEITEIITILQRRTLPESVDQDDLPFIDKWRASLNHIP
ncbi:uncharacterized protein [Rutidosis leptorrhynchoides]|uniref:uncharacterized protein n=1 Tax=Rutidosis leptorrhynchoides TaxID=125765 RepID=UPI003A99D18F